MNHDIEKIIAIALVNNLFKRAYSYSFDNFIAELEKELNIEIKEKN